MERFQNNNLQKKNESKEHNIQQHKALCQTHEIIHAKIMKGIRGITLQ